MITEKDNQVNCVAYDPTGLQFATGGSDTTVRVYDGAKHVLRFSGENGQPEVSAGHTNMIYAVKFHPTDPNILISGGWDNTIQVWDTRAPRSVKSIFGPHVCGESIDFNHDGTKIITGSHSNNDVLHVYDFPSGTSLGPINWSRTKSLNRYCPLYTLRTVHGQTRPDLFKMPEITDPNVIPHQHEPFLESIVIAGGGPGEGNSGGNEIRVFNLANRQVSLFISSTSFD